MANPRYNKKRLQTIAISDFLSPYTPGEDGSTAGSIRDHFETTLALQELAEKTVAKKLQQIAQDPDLRPLLEVQLEKLKRYLGEDLSGTEAGCEVQLAIESMNDILETEHFAQNALDFAHNKSPSVRESLGTIPSPQPPSDDSGIAAFDRGAPGVRTADLGSPGLGFDSAGIFFGKALKEIIEGICRYEKIYDTEGELATTTTKVLLILLQGIGFSLERFSPALLGEEECSLAREDRSAFSVPQYKVDENSDLISRLSFTGPARPATPGGLYFSTEGDQATRERIIKNVRDNKPDWIGLFEYGDDTRQTSRLLCMLSNEIEGSIALSKYSTDNSLEVSRRKSVMVAGGLSLEVPASYAEGESLQKNATNFTETSGEYYNLFDQEPSELSDSTLGSRKESELASPKDQLIFKFSDKSGFTGGNDTSLKYIALERNNISVKGLSDFAAGSSLIGDLFSKKEVQVARAEGTSFSAGSSQISRLHSYLSGFSNSLLSAAGHFDYMRGGAPDSTLSPLSLLKMLEDTAKPFIDLISSGRTRYVASHAALFDRSHSKRFQYLLAEYTLMFSYYYFLENEPDLIKDKRFFSRKLLGLGEDSSFALLKDGISLAIGKKGDYNNPNSYTPLFGESKGRKSKQAPLSIAIADFVAKSREDRGGLLLDRKSKYAASGGEIDTLKVAKSADGRARDNKYYEYLLADYVIGREDSAFVCFAKFYANVLKEIKKKSDLNNPRARGRISVFQPLGSGDGEYLVTNRNGVGQRGIFIMCWVLFRNLLTDSVNLGYLRDTEDQKGVVNFYYNPDPRGFINNRLKEARDNLRIHQAGIASIQGALQSISSLMQEAADRLNDLTEPGNKILDEILPIGGSSTIPQEDVVTFFSNIESSIRNAYDSRELLVPRERKVPRNVDAFLEENPPSLLPNTLKYSSRSGYLKAFLKSLGSELDSGFDASGVGFNPDNAKILTVAQPNGLLDSLKQSSVSFTKNDVERGTDRYKTTPDIKSIKVEVSKRDELLPDVVFSKMSVDYDVNTVISSYVGFGARRRLGVVLKRVVKSDNGRLELKWALPNRGAKEWSDLDRREKNAAVSDLLGHCILTFSGLSLQIDSHQLVEALLKQSVDKNFANQDTRELLKSALRSVDNLLLQALLQSNDDQGSYLVSDLSEIAPSLKATNPAQVVVIKQLLSSVIFNPEQTYRAILYPKKFEKINNFLFDPDYFTVSSIGTPSRLALGPEGLELLVTTNRGTSVSKSGYNEDNSGLYNITSEVVVTRETLQDNAELQLLDDTPSLQAPTFPDLVEAPEDLDVLRGEGLAGRIARISGNLGPQ